MGFVEKFVRQCRKPQGFLGRVVGRAMNAGHSKVRRWGLSYISSESYVSVLDIGCGGGAALRDMASIFPRAKLYGIDYSQDMVLLAKKVNKGLMEKGRIEINQGSVSSLPFADNTFDLVTAFEAYYFWPDLHNDLQEIKRVLLPGGTLLLVNEVYENEKFQERNRKWASWADMHLHTPAGYREFLTAAGYETIEVHESVERNWISALGIKSKLSS
ncbi:MAG: methyltransferase domain-containing protein [Deltaproteobacteria bacterium]|nr:methyltransferase domain-containing protein [Deltaproteobacteria bacterium]MBN2845891.1 methyltransferase domain-containing protein [Deltaproteobacteria bacterium]